MTINPSQFINNIMNLIVKKTASFLGNFTSNPNIPNNPDNNNNNDGDRSPSPENLESTETTIDIARVKNTKSYTDRLLNEVWLQITNEGVIRELRGTHGEDGWALLDHLTPKYLQQFLTRYNQYATTKVITTKDLLTKSTNSSSYSRSQPFVLPPSIPSLVYTRNYVISDSLYLTIEKGFLKLNHLVPEKLSFNHYFNLVIQTTSPNYWMKEDLYRI